MLRVEVDDKNIEIKFDHCEYVPHKIRGMTGIVVDDNRRCSVATVTINDKFFGRGISICHPNDNFCRRIGRREALTDAIYSLDKSIRTAIWNEYKANCKFKG